MKLLNLKTHTAQSCGMALYLLAHSGACIETIHGGIMQQKQANGGSDSEQVSKQAGLNQQPC